MFLLCIAYSLEWNNWGGGINSTYNPLKFNRDVGLNFQMLHENLQRK